MGTEPWITAHLGQVYCDGRPAGRSVMLLLNRIWDAPDMAEAYREHRVRMRRLHSSYRRRWR